MPALANGPAYSISTMLVTLNLTELLDSVFAKTFLF